MRNVQTMHFFALKRQKNKCKFLSFLEYRVSLLTSSFLGFRAQAIRVSYKPVSYIKKNVYLFQEPHVGKSRVEITVHKFTF